MHYDLAGCRFTLGFDRWEQYSEEHGEWEDLSDKRKWTDPRDGKKWVGPRYTDTVLCIDCSFLSYFKSHSQTYFTCVIDRFQKLIERGKLIAKGQPFKSQDITTLGSTHTEIIVYECRDPHKDPEWTDGLLLSFLFLISSFFYVIGLLVPAVMSAQKRLDQPQMRTHTHTRTDTQTHTQMSISIAYLRRWWTSSVGNCQGGQRLVRQSCRAFSMRFSFRLSLPLPHSWVYT